MASVVHSASKRSRDRRGSDQMRIQAGHMLCFDDLSARDDVTERSVLKKVIKKSISKGQGLMQLPLALAIFLAFASSGFAHEDITNEFFVESILRRRTDEIFGSVGTIEEWWSAVLDTSEQGMVGWLFGQADDYGTNRTKSSDEDPLFGNWARVGQYNQLQAAVRFETTRPTAHGFGTEPYGCASEFECALCADAQDNGFLSAGSLQKGVIENLSRACSLSPVAMEDRSEDFGEQEGAAPRRLRLGDMTLRNFLPPATAGEHNTFLFHIYPGEPQEKILARLRYYRARGWLDAETETARISMYFLNSELGRPRLEQLTIQFYFSASGEIVYERALLPIFLKFWPPHMAGKISMAADASFLVLLVFTTTYRFARMWMEFLKSSLFSHVTQMSTLFELMNILCGWYCMMNLWGLRGESAKVTQTLTEVRHFGLLYPPTPEMQEANDAFWEQALASAAKFEGVGLLWAWYTLLLQFRFFANFGAQPRLALVTNTIRAVLVDLVHFCIVLFPTFLTYAFAGTLLFGRRMADFATLAKALATCFRIMIESEYPWDELSAEYYVTAGIWSWTFIMVVAILMINMVLAIILDVYKQVHDGDVSSEPIWESLYQVLNRWIHMRGWVSFEKIQDQIDKNFPPHLSFIEMDDIRGEFPDIPQAELDQLYRQCRKDMASAALKDLDKQNLVRLSGGIMVTTNKVNQLVSKINDEDNNDPLKSWVEPVVGATAEALSDLDKCFLTVPVSAKGGRTLNLCKPVDEDEEEKSKDTDEKVHPDAQPDWLVELNRLLAAQKRWMEHSTSVMQNMQWHVQVAHLARAGGEDAALLLRHAGEEEETL